MVIPEDTYISPELVHFVNNVSYASAHVGTWRCSLQSLLGGVGVSIQIVTESGHPPPDATYRSDRDERRLSAQGQLQGGQQQSDGPRCRPAAVPVLGLTLEPALVLGHQPTQRQVVVVFLAAQMEPAHADLVLPAGRGRGGQVWCSLGEEESGQVMADVMLIGEKGD